jgi:hypothetical protein
VPHLWNLDVLQEVDAQVFDDDAVAGGKERQDVTDKVLFILRELLPVRRIAAEVDLLGCVPRAGCTQQFEITSSSTALQYALTDLVVPQYP